MNALSLCLCLIFLLLTMGRAAADAPALTLGEFQIDGQTAPLGHVFPPKASVRLPLTTAGDSVQWTLRDFWDDIAAPGREPVTNGRASIAVPTATNGYFLLSVEARSGGQTIARRDISLAVVPPTESPKGSDNNPFGVMTHFAQGWDTDVLPLLARAGIGSIRDEHYWAQIETKKNQYLFSERDNHYMTEAAKYGLDPLIPLTKGTQP
ncbi:MAG: hypothetical protein M3Y13_11580 [Armatimonadota bacterium]|nr:hypothetical protein [Armatimonadota bacterium]